jgi:hypothetical protein
MGQVFGKSVPSASKRRVGLERLHGHRCADCSGPVSGRTHHQNGGCGAVKAAVQTALTAQPHCLMAEAHVSQAPKNHPSGLFRGRIAEDLVCPLKEAKNELSS